MKRIFSITAFTLIELIVSLLLVSVIVMGIVSIDMVLNNNTQDYGQRYLVKSQTQTTLNHILNNASLAVGSGTSDAFGNLDLGILSGAGASAAGGVGNANSFCIHQLGTSNVPPGQNIISAAADIWLCYTWYAAGVNTNQIYWCTTAFTPAAGAASYRGANLAAPCTAASANYTYLGTAFSVSNPIGAPPTSPSFFTSGEQFEITIKNCLNDSLATCGAASDPASNPFVTISGSITPSQEGTG